MHRCQCTLKLLVHAGYGVSPASWSLKVCSHGALFHRMVPPNWTEANLSRLKSVVQNMSLSLEPAAWQLTHSATGETSARRALLRRCASALTTFWLVGCGGTTIVDPPICSPGSSLEGDQCRVYAERTVERIATSLMEGGGAVNLQMIVYRPLSSAPYPTLIFHHGSTGNGDDPSLFSQVYSSETLAKAFVDRGFMVLFPQRRGRGGSGGLYDEGFEADRSRYSCSRSLALAGLERALEDADAIRAHVLTRADVNTARIVVGGISRGGILAVAHAARHPAPYRGVVNFVGGWIGELCSDAVAVNKTTFTAAAAATLPTLWLYGENDPFYSVAHSRANFDAFRSAGGNGTFHVYRRSNPTFSGHFIINEPTLWDTDLRSFINQVSP